MSLLGVSLKLRASIMTSSHKCSEFGFFFFGGGGGNMIENMVIEFKRKYITYK